MDKNEFLREIKLLQQISDRAMAGEEVYCPKCGELLIVNQLGSRKHPGVFCPNKDFKIMIDYKKNNVTENLGLDKRSNQQ